ncbi:MAG TPA: type II toxin-antitoxin system VapC family toxin [Thermoplasmata archaeon]
MPPRFVDASVFVHAYLRPRRELKAHERAMKAHARRIVARINEGEEVVTSTIHVSEIANVLEDWMPLADAMAVEQGLCTRDSLRILPTEKDDLLEALAVSSEVGLGLSDALAIALMREEGLLEIYSFDRDFDRLPEIKRVSE